MATYMKVEKVQAGAYKVTTDKGVYMVCGGINYNPDSPHFRGGNWEVWDAASYTERTNENCWACGAPSKKVALQWISEL